MISSIDLNADIGEGMPYDAELITLISSAHIACGYHAGDRDLMLRTVEACMRQGVAVGAHPSFADREHFGRREQSWNPAMIRQILDDQLGMLQECCHSLGTFMKHVKPHGALYNMSARDPELARAIADAIVGFDPGLRLYGLSGSHSIVQASVLGLPVASEAFADRRYRGDGSLLPRQEAGAVIEDLEEAVQQAICLAEGDSVNTADGSLLHIAADSICIHGDGPHALPLAELIVKNLQTRGIRIAAIA